MKRVFSPTAAVDIDFHAIGLDRSIATTPASDQRGGLVAAYPEIDRIFTDEHAKGSRLGYDSSRSRKLLVFERLDRGLLPCALTQMTIDSNRLLRLKTLGPRGIHRRRKDGECG